MRVIGHLENEQAAQRFGDFLYVHGIVNTVEREEPAWAIWVHDDDHLKRAGDVDFSRVVFFQMNPIVRKITVQAREAYRIELEDLGTGEITFRDVPARPAGAAARLLRRRRPQ